MHVDVYIYINMFICACSMHTYKQQCVKQLKGWDADVELLGMHGVALKNDIVCMGHACVRIPRNSFSARVATNAGMNAATKKFPAFCSVQKRCPRHMRKANGTAPSIKTLAVTCIYIDWGVIIGNAR